MSNQHVFSIEAVLSQYWKWPQAEHVAPHHLDGRGTASEAISRHKDDITNCVNDDNNDCDNDDDNDDVDDDIIRYRKPTSLCNATRMCWSLPCFSCKRMREFPPPRR